MSELMLARSISTLGNGKHFESLPIYDRHFARFKDLSPVVLEIGVREGTSLALWRSYFGPNSFVAGIDIEPKCKKIEDAGNNIHVFIGDQSDPEFLKSVVDQIGSPDIVIDDGSHDQRHVKISFETLYPLLTRNGVYLVEDLHMAYNKGVPVENSFVEYTKHLLDLLNSEVRKNPLTQFAILTQSVHVYMSHVVVERGVNHIIRRMGTKYFSFEDNGYRLDTLDRDKDGPT